MSFHCFIPLLTFVRVGFAHDASDFELELFKTHFLPHSVIQEKAGYSSVAVFQVYCVYILKELVPKSQVNNFGSWCEQSFGSLFIDTTYLEFDVRTRHSIGA